MRLCSFKRATLREIHRFSDPVRSTVALLLGSLANRVHGCREIFTLGLAGVSTGFQNLLLNFSRQSLVTVFHKFYFNFVSIEWWLRKEKLRRGITSIIYRRCICEFRREVLRVLFLLFLGQLLSFFLAVASFTSSLLANLGINTPLTQSLFNYLALALVYGSILLHRRKKLKVSWYWYIILALIDVQGNFLVVKAYQFSSITSVTLLDCCTIVWVIILTRIVLGTRYTIWQIVGAVLCVVAVGLILLSDAGDSVEAGGRNPLLGDVLVVAGTLFYAMSNVGEEFCVKKMDRVEVVAMLGAFGSLVSICQISIFERKNLESVQWSATTIALYVGFASATFLFYNIVPFVLKMGGSTLFNLSLLTTDMWAIVIRILFYHQQVNWLYYLSFAVVTLGLIIYSINCSSSAPTTLPDSEAQYQALDGENVVSIHEVVVVN